jgi:hypothetical protein
MGSRLMFGLLAGTLNGAADGKFEFESISFYVQNDCPIW